MTADKRKSRGSSQAFDHRVARLREHSLKPPPKTPNAPSPSKNAVLDCGWGRVIFSHTFKEPQDLIDEIRSEGPGRRDIAFYVRDPHVVLGLAPQDLFLDPSHTYRLDLNTYRSARSKPAGFFVRRLSSEEDAQAVNRIYEMQGMVPVRPEFFWTRRNSRAVTYLVAEDRETGDIIGTVTGINHARAFDDPECGSSLWCLAVDPQAQHARIGEALVRKLAEHLQARGANFMDLSVLHDNDPAIRLYEKLGLHRVPYFTLKRKNPINEPLFARTSDEDEHHYNPYAMIIIQEARRRGIGVEPIDPDGGLFRLTYGGRSVACRESLTELTTAIALSICDDKAVTRRIVRAAGVNVPARLKSEEPEEIESFLEKYGSLVVKPARGEQGQGVAVGLETLEDVRTAIDVAKNTSDTVLIEECVNGMDLRLIVIDFRVVAAAVRQPPVVVGDGKATVRQLIEKQSRRRAAATGGESHIPLDGETERCVSSQGFSLDDVPEQGKQINVRKTANLHTGGTMHDVTDILHPKLIEAAVKAARAIDIPVTGIDFMVKAPDQPDYWFVEANERPGLANHEPQPTAERFIDMLFPQSLPLDSRLARKQPDTTDISE